MEVPRRAAAAARPSAEKLDTVEGSSCFFLPPNNPPRKPSFSFLDFSLLSLSLSLPLSFLEKKPPFFSFSFSFSLSLAADGVSVRDMDGRGVSRLTGIMPMFSLEGCVFSVVRGAAMPGGRSVDGRAVGRACGVVGDVGDLTELP